MNHKRTSIKSKIGRRKRVLKWCLCRPRWQKITAVIISSTVLFFSGMYGVAQWYIARHAKEPLTYGVTFIPRYARYLDLDPKETMQAMIDDLGVKRFRLVSYWNDYEPEQGKYNFDELDWEFQKAQDAGAKVSLSIGLRQPRWPECHMPSWAQIMGKDEWATALKNYMKVVIERYRNSPALDSYQLENEFFMKVFGICPDFSRERLVDEFYFVKSLDPNHPVIIARSNNWVGLPLGDPRPDGFAISVYKRVWDKAITKRYFEYPLPAWFYAGLAGGAELLTGRDMIIHELQAEPWAPNEQSVKNISLTEQDKSMNAVRLKDRFEYGRATGMRTIDLWGAEWWYWRKVKFGDTSLWDTAKQQMLETRNDNRKAQALSHP